MLAPQTAHVPPGAHPNAWHSHRTIEGVYVVIEGQVRIELGDEVTTLGPHDAVLIPPETPVLVRNDSEQAFLTLSITSKTTQPSCSGTTTSRRLDA